MKKTISKKVTMKNTITLFFTVVLAYFVWIFFIQRPITYGYFSLTCNKQPLIIVKENSAGRHFSFWPGFGKPLYLEPGEVGYLRYALLPSLTKNTVFGCDSNNFDNFITEEDLRNLSILQQEIDLKNGIEAISYASKLKALMIVDKRFAEKPYSYVRRDGKKSLTLEQKDDSNNIFFVVHSETDTCAEKSCVSAGYGNLNNEIFTLSRKQYITQVNGQFIEIEAQAGSNIDNEELLNYAKNLIEYKVSDFEDLVKSK